MSQQERWDVVLKLLSGPQSSLGEQVRRGPVVRIGANPGPGGLTLSGYRGLDPRQCVITVYDGKRVEVAPVGTNQVRMAPHANVRWKDIDPIYGPELMSSGCAIHLGPVGRGATVEFVECRRLGEWETGRLASEAAVAPAAPEIAGMPASYDARRVGNVRTSSAPFWFMGCTFLMGSVAIFSMIAVGLIIYGQRNVARIGPVQQGVEFYESITEEEIDAVPESLLKGVHQGFDTFVMIPNRTQADQPDGWTDPKSWDQNFYKHVGASMSVHLRAWAFFERLDQVKNDYAMVTRNLRAEGLPEVFAAIPYQESRYEAGAQSFVCAKGYWQFMPEVAHRVDVKTDIEFRVKDCAFRGSKVRWTPRDLAPPPGVRRNGDYMRDGNCVITGCLIDDRMDLEKSTAAAMYALREAWEDPKIKSSGAAVQLTITSHNAGYDDSRFGKKKRSNVLPALERWVSQTGKSNAAYFMGGNIKCENHHFESGYCGSLLPAEAQHYAYTIVAQHLVAACYYAKNYGDDPTFRPWRRLLGEDGYCNSFKIPTRQEVKARRLKRRKK